MYMLYTGIGIIESHVDDVVVIATHINFYYPSNSFFSISLL